MSEVLCFCPQTADSEPGVFVEGVHAPGTFTQKSGVWPAAAGSALLMQDAYSIPPIHSPAWLVCEEGKATLNHALITIEMSAGQCVVVPADTDQLTLSDCRDARMLWFTLDGPLTRDYMNEMNAFALVPARQGILPNMIELIRQMMQVLVRHDGTADADFQLQQLLWGLLAMHSGQSVATSVTLSHEIARVVDTLRMSDWRENFSLNEMAEISRMPVESFRKRFTGEVGVPPLVYLQFLKMERAKRLLRSGVSVRQAGVEIGMSDPYHFSKQFKRVVGMSPLAYLKHIEGEPRTRATRVKKKIDY